MYEAESSMTKLKQRNDRLLSSEHEVSCQIYSLNRTKIRRNLTFIRDFARYNGAKL